MQSIFDMTLLDSMLVQSALRALALALVVGAGLTLLRIRNSHHQLTAWTAVLVGALAMPVLMMWMVVSVPMEETVLPAGKIAESLTSVVSLSAEAASAAETPARLDGALETSAPFNWAGLAHAIYGVVAGVLLLRLTVGLVQTARIRAQAVRIGASWTGGSDIRMSQAVMAPVTVGSTILLPADFESWSNEKRTAVLLHERAHVARGDFYVQIFAGLHRAVFWFSPMAWWRCETASWPMPARPLPNTWPAFPRARWRRITWAWWSCKRASWPRRAAVLKKPWCSIRSCTAP